MNIDYGLAASIAAGAMVLLAIAAGVGDHRRKTRTNLDRISLVDWPTVQFVALAAAFLFASLAFHLG